MVLVNKQDYVLAKVHSPNYAVPTGGTFEWGTPSYPQSSTYLPIYFSLGNPLLYTQYFSYMVPYNNFYIRVPILIELLIEQNIILLQIIVLYFR